VRLNDAFLDQAKREASRRHVTLTELIEEGLRLAMAQSKPANSRRIVDLPICRAGGGTLPGVDLNDGAGLLDRMEQGS
jgi:hypothetical protein